MLSSYLLAVGLIVAQTLVGVVVAAWLLPHAEISFRIALGLLIGILVTVLQQQVFISVGARDAYIPVLLVSALGSTLRLLTRLKGSKFSVISASVITRRGISVALVHLSAVLWLLVPDWGWPLAFAALCLAVGSLLSAVRIGTKVLCGLAITITAVWSYWTIHHLMPQTWWFVDEDLYWYYALGRGISQYGFWENPFIVGRPFNYHWLPYAWSGWISSYVGDSDLRVFATMFPAVISIAFVAMFRGVFSLINSRTISPYLVAAASATTTLWITSRSLAPVGVISLGTSLGHLGSLAVFGLLLYRMKFGLSWRITIALSLASAFLVGAKIHSALPILAGLLVALCIHEISERGQFRSVPPLAFVVSVIFLSFYVFYASQSSQGRLKFSMTPRFEYVNTWGDMAESSHLSRTLGGLVVGVAYLIPLLAGAVMLAYLPVQRVNKERRHILTFLTVAAVVAMSLAATVQQVSSTSFLFLDFAPTLGGVLIFSGLASTSRTRLLVFIAIGVLVVWVLINLPQVRNYLFEIDWKLERFRLFLLWNLVFASAILVLVTCVKQQRAANRTDSLPQWILVTAALSQLIAVHALNYHSMGTQTIPARSRQGHLLPPAQTEIALASWFKLNTTLDAIVVSNNYDMRLPALVGRRWFLSSPVFSTDGTEEISRRGQLLASFLEAPDKIGLEILRVEGVDFFVFDNSHSGSTLDRSLEDTDICYRDSRFEVAALERCP